MAFFNRDRSLANGAEGFFSIVGNNMAVKTRKPRYKLQVGQLGRLLSLGLIAWLPAMASVTLLAFGRLTTLPAISLGLLGGLATVALSTWRSLRQQPLFHLKPDPVSGSNLKLRRWSEVANPKGNQAGRWAMYQDLSAWLAERNWTGKIIAEVGGNNGVLRSFMGEAQFRELPYPEYDVQNLHQIRDNEVDLIILDQTLEHLPDPERALREVHRVLKPGAFTIVTTPFLLPVHKGSDFGDYYRWTPLGMEVVLRRCGFEPVVSAWGNLKAAKALLENMYLRADQARPLGLSLSKTDNDKVFPITVWATAVNLKTQ